MSDFNYKDKTAPKLTDEFKQKFGVNIKGKDGSLNIASPSRFLREIPRDLTEEAF